jgi:anti-anti-sigma factor
MSISFQDVGEDLRRITISGLLDMEGTEALSAQLMELVEAPKTGVVIYLTNVRFLASVGIRILVASAKAVQERGGKLVLVVSPGSSVAMSLEATGVNAFIPVFANSTDAEKAVLK